MQIPFAKQIAVLLFDGCAFQEVANSIGLLSGFFKIVMVGSAEKLITTQEGFRVQIDIALGDLAFSEFEALVIPGGESEAAFHDSACIEGIRAAAAAGALVAGICNGALLMAKAEILGGKNCTHTCTDAYAPYEEFEALRSAADIIFLGSHFVDQDVVVDGKIITAKPWANIEFATTIGQRLGMLDERSAEQQNSYLRGKRPAYSASIEV